MRNTDDFVDGQLTPAEREIMEEILSENDPTVVKQLLEGVLEANQWAREVNPEAYEVHPTEENNEEQSPLLRESGFNLEELDTLMNRWNAVSAEMAPIIKEILQERQN
jgi:lysyl-tRNA synthetase class I